MEFVGATGYQTDAEKDGKEWSTGMSDKEMTQDPSLIWKSPEYDVIVVSWLKLLGTTQSFCNWLSDVQGAWGAYRQPRTMAEATAQRVPAATRPVGIRLQGRRTTNYFWAPMKECSGTMRIPRIQAAKPIHDHKTANPFSLFDMQGNVSGYVKIFMINRTRASIRSIR